ncbi:mannosyltransferase putative-domain-containing protein [Obelidium mucronatum]|nr:mannosyltransferase putative-domain-containing protein [Obelidium mucronatum]
MLPKISTTSLRRTALRPRTAVLFFVLVLLLVQFGLPTGGAAAAKPKEEVEAAAVEAATATTKAATATTTKEKAWVYAGTEAKAATASGATAALTATATATATATETPTDALKDPRLSIDMIQAQFIDYLNGEEGASESAVFGGSLLNLTVPFNPKQVWKPVHQYALSIQSLEYNREDILELARRARAMLIAYKILHEQQPMMTLVSESDKEAATVQVELEQVLSNLTTTVYGWTQPFYKTIHDMQLEYLDPSTPEMGLVFSTGKEHFEFAIHGILSLRNLLNCTLPIEVQYMGANDLDVSMLAALDSIPGVKTVDILKKFGASEISGWAIKPFALLAAGFRTSIFIDADALFFQDPEVMVNNSLLFKEYGQLFYMDRSIFQPKYDSVDWFYTIDPVMTKYASTLRYTTNRSNHEMESGVVVVDKSRSDVLHALLLTCQMNSKTEREVVYSHVYGDKETFWMAWDMLRVPFKFTPNAGGTLGRKTETGSVCGPLFHTDEFNNPLWWNGGPFECKYLTTDAYLQFEYAAFETNGTGHKWEMQGEMPLCLLPGNTTLEVIKLNAEQKKLGSGFIDLYEELRSEGGWKSYFTKTFGLSF